MTQATGTKHKIAVIGGGISAMTAVFQITGRPGWDEIYDITVYQSGFRLGGKGASGRNRAHGDRIEEHGLHIFMGFYENAFQVMRACYEELDRPPGSPIRSWDQAFAPHDHVVLFEQREGEWKPWHLPFPRTAGSPGDGSVLPPIWSYIPMILEAMLRVLAAFEVEGSSVARILDRVVGAAREQIEDLIDEVLGPSSARGSILLRALRNEPDPVKPFVQRAPVKLFATVVRALRRLLDEMGLDGGPLVRRRVFDALVPLVEQLREEAREELAKQADIDDHARRTWILVDLMTTNVRGLIVDGIVFPPFPFESVDHLDYKAWLRKHGAHPQTVESAPVNAIYDLVFSRDVGICAGSALRGSLRMMLTYKGSIFWKMQAGMGDVIFAPMFEVLRRRGVKFRFFHRLDDVRLSPDRREASELVFGRQATVKGGREYQPLFDVKGLPCWPSEPLWDQLVEGERFAREGRDLENFFDKSADVEHVRLKVGVDFDTVILGVSIGALPYVAAEVVENSPKLKGAVQHIRTTATQAVQLWFKPDLAKLGWSGPSPVTTAFAKPFDTWADMTHLVQHESFGNGEVGNIAYLCGHLPDPKMPDLKADPHPAANASTRSNALAWLHKNTRCLWPHAARDEGIDYELLVDPKNGRGDERLSAQYIRCSVNPSDRYVQSAPGSTAYRPRTEETNLKNLFVTGDWIQNGIQGGCAEAAVMAGLQTARAICGSPEVIFGDATPAPVSPLVRGLMAPKTERREYIERGGELILRAPYQQNGTRLYAFLLNADPEKLQALCDRYLNIGRTKYRPFAPFVALGCADIASLRSLNPEDMSKGFMTERDVAFWIPVLGENTSHNCRVDQHLAWFLPYIFVDSAAPMAVGREVYGFPKLAGRIDFGEIEGRGTLVSVDALAIDRFSPATRAREQRIVEVRRKADSDHGPISLLWNAFEKAASGLSQGIYQAAEQVLQDAALDAAASILREVSPSEPVRMVFLKQFRDVGDPKRACYQAIVSANATVTGFRAGGLLEGPFEVRIQELDSHPIIEELGLAGDRLEPAFSCWLDFDFDVDEGCVMP
ncbi:MAG: NAD(P)-binding protein [Polyangiaceae bacterium]|nr:NAD(P)-binding protein [Polyangiaceae bacterium]